MGFWWIIPNEEATWVSPKFYLMKLIFYVWYLQKLGYVLAEEPFPNYWKALFPTLKKLLVSVSKTIPDFFKTWW